MLRALLIILLSTNLVFGKFNFTNYSLYRIHPKNSDQIKLFQDLKKTDKYDFWSEPAPNVDYVSVLASPENKNDLENLLKHKNINFEITLPNIQDVIDKEVIQSYTRSNLKSMQWNAYYTLDGIYGWLEDLAYTYPSTVSIITGGHSYEGRDIKGIRISHGAGRKAIFIEGGIHAREWISPAVVNYITNELVTGSNEEVKAAARDFDWYIFPVTNPDGYVWTYQENGFRLWRKNRQPYGNQYGVDLNRNWNNNWLQYSVSVNPASDVYAGPGPFSEPETRSLSYYIRSISHDIELYLSFHSSGQLLLLPYGNTTTPLANYYDAINIGRRAMGALSVRYGTQYTTGNIAEAIYFATGTSLDWVKEHLNVPLAYCYELRDRGTYGHLLPADQILPSGEETMDSVLELIYQARRFGYLDDLQNSDSLYDFWTDPIPSAEYVSVLASPGNKGELERILNVNNIVFDVMMSNIQEAIDKEKVNTYARSNIRNMTWDAYYVLDDIYYWMKDLAVTYPAIANVIVGGISYEGREIRGIRISHGSGRRVVFLEGGIHSREWISPSAVCYILNELLTSDDEEIQAIAREFDWYIFPVTNPDGYVWTHEQFRMWRKNRRPIGNNFGVDLNRNWNNNWLVAGANTNPATDIYAGPGPFSEPETRSLSDFIRSIGDRIDLYLSFHSFSQLLLIPFGNTTEPVGNYYDALNIGRRAMGALSVRYGTQYITGNIAEAIYQATGGSIDWVKEQLNVPLVYCYELRDRGAHGFLLPEDQILPNNQETMDSLIDLIHQAKRFGYMRSGVAGSSYIATVVLAILFFIVNY
ncbi:zinc carboxypeptidase A 1 [Amyelois transitella]|uniref:zinc carboxypeptidase A 1 n=1 Tax=Amyelois transitella TaxID=680683 RepID=UPI00298F57EE|nr:zinc carboxypeptidase A 1 [Amyelois transitella]